MNNYIAQVQRLNYGTITTCLKPRSHALVYTWYANYTCMVNMHPGVKIYLLVYLHMCKLTFTYMQLRSHAQKYTRVQIIHICIIYTPCVNQRM